MARMVTAEVAPQIPGILQFDRRKSILRYPIKEGKLPALEISPLKLEEVGAFSAVMQRATLVTQGVSEEEREKTAAGRNAEFYTKAVLDPKSTVLVAKDANGEIVGGLHGEESHDDEDRVLGQKIGYVRFVGKDPEAAAKGVGQSLYGAYEKQLISMGATVMAAAVDNNNFGSHEFHRRFGMDYVALEKTPQPPKEADRKWDSLTGMLPSNRWVFKTIASIEGELPVSESDYMDFDTAVLAAIASGGMLVTGLGEVKVSLILGKKDIHGKPLINIMVENAASRRDFEAIMARIAEVAELGEISAALAVAAEAAGQRALRRSIIKG